MLPMRRRVAPQVSCAMLARKHCVFIIDKSQLIITDEEVSDRLQHLININWPVCHRNLRRGEGLLAGKGALWV